MTDLTIPKFLDRRLVEETARGLSGAVHGEPPNGLEDWKVREFVPHARHALFVEEYRSKSPPPPRIRVRRRR